MGLVVETEETLEMLIGLEVLPGADEVTFELLDTSELERVDKLVLELLDGLEVD